MKKIKSRRNILSALMCMCIAFTLPSVSTPAQAVDVPTIPQMIQDAGMQGGMNQMHDTNYLKERYQDNYRNEDYQYYQRKKELEEIPAAKKIKSFKTTMAVLCSRQLLKN